MAAAKQPPSSGGRKPLTSGSGRSSNEVGNRPMSRSGHVLDAPSRTGDGTTNARNSTTARNSIRNGNGRDTDRSGGQSQVAAASGRAGAGNGERWWDGVSPGTSDRDRMRLSATAHQLADQYHLLADSLYDPFNDNNPSRARAGNNGNSRSSTAKAPAKKAAAIKKATASNTTTKRSG